MLQVPDELPLHGDDIRVDHACSFWNEPASAVLTVTPGRMEIRHSLVPLPHLCLAARPENAFGICPRDALCLTQDDLCCRTEVVFRLGV